MQTLDTRMRILVTTVLISSVVAGCAITKDQVLPQDLRSMKTIYDEHFENRQKNDATVRQELQKRNSTHLPKKEARLWPVGVAPDHYVRSASNEIGHLFPRLRNPDLVMFIYPHLAGPEGSPIPGYATVFPMYEKEQYALPGEASGLY